jgi:5-oxoprolinase (ATP-hydrolysing) subunit A
MGESFGPWKMGNDLSMLEHVSSANIACGFHAGDPSTMRHVVNAAAARGVAIGAHPGFPDLQGFGRREMNVSPSDVYAMTLYQVGALAAFVRATGARLHHVKPHGALYNMAAKNRPLADALAQAVRDIDPTLVFYGLAGSVMISSAQAIGLACANEVFADRTYEADGSLVSRSIAGAMIEDEEDAVSQVRLMLDGRVRARSGDLVVLQADTVCLHGDQPGAVAFAKRLADELKRDGVRVAAPRAP